MTRVAIVSAARTPIGTFGGALKNTHVVDLGTLVIKEAIRRSGIKPEEVDEVIMGNVLTGGMGMNTARQATIRAGLPDTTPAFTINKVCGSGLKSVALAAQAIQLGDAEVVVAGGMESMSTSSYVLPAARWGARMGHGQMIDTMILDGLTCAMADCHMGITAENVAERHNISREAQDAFAVESQQKAGAAISAGKFKQEIVPVNIPQRKGEPKIFDTDEHPRPDSTVEVAAKLGVEILTLYAFSRENWKRPQAEITTLMTLLREYLKKELPELQEQNIRLDVIGRIEDLPPPVQRELELALSSTAGNDGMTLCVALSYGGRAEIVDACKSIMRAGLSPDELDPEVFARHLYTAKYPDPDLLIRTSGELRISNFLLWQIAYAEIWVTDTLWPDFRRSQLFEALLDYQRRERLPESDGHPRPRSEYYLALTVGYAYINQCVVGVECYGVYPGCPRPTVRADRGLLHDAVRGGEEDERLLELPHRQDRPG